MKKIISFALCLLMMFACLNVSAINNISVELDANKLEFDTPATNIDGRVLVPVRAIFEAIGATVTWNETTRSVISKLNGKTVIMTIDSPIMTINGEKIKLDVTPKILNDRTMVPVRAATEAFNADVLWDAANNTVKITTREFLSRIKNLPTHHSSKTLSSEGQINSNFSISYFEEYDVRIDANDGTDFEIVSQSDTHFALLSVRADVYAGSEQPLTEAYAKSVAEGMVRAVSGTLNFTGITKIGTNDFIEIQYTNPGVVNNIDDNVADVLVYMGIKNGVVYTMTYMHYGNVPLRVNGDINYMIDTLKIN